MALPAAGPIGRSLRGARAPRQSSADLARAGPRPHLSPQGRRAIATAPPGRAPRSLL